jgi:hypothetical protein
MPSVEVERRFAASVEEVWRVYFSKSWLEVEGKPDRNGAGAVRGLAAYAFPDPRT